jgi:hypothetical protein
VGLTTDSDHQEKLLPQRDAVVAGNLIADNQQTARPNRPTADGASASASTAAVTTGSSTTVSTTTSTPGW